MDDFIGGDDDADLFDPNFAQAQLEAKAEKIAVDADAASKFLRRCQQAYRAVFVAGNATPDDVRFVMQDLAWFCAAHDPQWRKDPREQDRMVARREVYQRIVEYTRFDHDTLAAMYIKAQQQ